MAVGQRASLVLGPIEGLFRRGTVSGLSEGQLLARFLCDRDEVAFEAIVSRHGPMVLGVCRRLLDDPHDVEDAFQATFLVLVRRARSLRDRDLLANWLYGVALRIATRCRRDRTRRRLKERSDVHDVAAPTDDTDLGELRFVIDVEVARLPGRFRVPILLCYFEGLTHDQAAERLGCPVGTVRSRMAKARELLRARLARRGFGPASAIPAVPLVGISPAVPPALLVRTTVAAGAAAGRSLFAGGVSLSALSLARGVLRAMTFTRWMTIAAALVVLGAAGSGVRVAARQDSTPAAKLEAPDGRQKAAGRPARKALEEVQATINHYEAQLNLKQVEIDRLKEEMANLNDRIHRLEAKARAVTGNVASTAGSGNAGTGAKPSGPGQITTSRQAIVWASPSHDRVVIFAPETGRSRAYRSPAETDQIDAVVSGSRVMLVANGPTTHQLAAYDLNDDRCAVQDLRRNEAGNRYIPWINQYSLAVLPLHFRGRGFTQLAVFDFTHFRWSVQDLAEPYEDEDKNVRPYLNDNVALYVLGRHLYAYSAQAGRWDTLTLEERLIPPPGYGQAVQAYFPTVKHDSVAVSQHGRLHVFTAKTGRWQTIDPKD